MLAWTAMEMGGGVLYRQRVAGWEVNMLMMEAAGVCRARARGGAFYPSSHSLPATLLRLRFVMLED